MAQLPTSFVLSGAWLGAKVSSLRSIGADRVIDYTREDFAKNEERYDLIIDALGNRSVSDLKRA